MVDRIALAVAKAEGPTSAAGPARYRRLAIRVAEAARHALGGAGERSMPAAERCAPSTIPRWLSALSP
jgi:hypothetical protein